MVGQFVYTSHMAAEPFRTARMIAGECPGMRVRAASRLLTRVYDEALRPLGIQASQLSVLVAVAMFGEEGAAMAGIARVLVMDPTTLTRNVRPLERSGLLRVARSPEDARRRIVFLTRAGERMVEAAGPLWKQALARIDAALGARRVEALREQLAEIIALAPRLEGGVAAKTGRK